MTLDPTIVLPYLSGLVGYGLFASYLVVKYYDFDRRMTMNVVIIVLWLVFVGPAVVGWMRFPIDSPIAYTISPILDAILFGGSLLMFVLIVVDAAIHWNRVRMGLA